MTTSIGAEGMCGELPWNGFIEDDFQKFAEKAEELFTDKDTWSFAQKNGVEIINKHYNKETLENEFLTLIGDVYADLKQHRNQNFTGKMLLHHSLQSSKYMSKWIEEKNK